MGRIAFKPMLDHMHVDLQNSVPSFESQVTFLVGQDGEGHWLAVETHGLGGGIFKSRDKAFRYARDESHRLPGAVRFVDGPIRLFMS